MLPALAGFAAKALLPSKKKIDKDKLLNKKESSAIQKIDGEKSEVSKPIVKKKKISTDLFLPQPEIKALPPATEVKKDVKSGKLDNIFDRVGKTLRDIISALKNRNKVQEEETKNQKQDAKIEEKKEREEKLEKDAKKKPFKIPSVRSPGDKFNLMRFFGNILLGSIVLAIFKNLEQIIETLKNAFQRIKDFITKLGEFFSPLWNGFKWIVGKGTELIGKLLGIPPENLSDKDILKNLNEIKDKIPFLKNLFEGINSVIESIRSGRGLSPAAAPGPSSYAPGTIPQSVSQDTEFTQGVTRLAQKYNVPEDYLYAVMGFETGGTFDPAQKNLAGSGATGLIQFMPSTAEGLGTTTEALSKMSRAEQLIYVDKYFASKNIEGGSLSDIYMSVLLPAAVGKPEDFVLFGEGGAYGGQRAYDQNKGLDLNKDGKITKAEATSKVAAYLPQGFTPTQTSTSPSASEQAKQIESSGTYTVGGITYDVNTGAPIRPPSPTQIAQDQPAQAQIAQDQPAPPISSSVPQIMQQAEYEIPRGTSSSTVVPMPIGGGSSPITMGGGGSRLIPVGVSKQELLNSYYQTQLTGFLYKQG